MGDMERGCACPIPPGTARLTGPRYSRAQAPRCSVLSPSLSPQHGYLESKASINNTISASTPWSVTRCSARNVPHCAGGSRVVRHGRRRLRGAGFARDRAGSRGAGFARDRAGSRTGSGGAKAGRRRGAGDGFFDLRGWGSLTEPFSLAIALDFKKISKFGSGRIRAR